MASHRLVDSYGRVADDLRISVTDRCNFRCIYCMPAEGLKWLAREDILRYEEIVRLARIFVERYGVRTIRITGGEPLVRVKLEERLRMETTSGPTSRSCRAAASRSRSRTSSRSSRWSTRDPGRRPATGSPTARWVASASSPRSARPSAPPATESG